VSAFDKINILTSGDSSRLAAGSFKNSLFIINKWKSPAIIKIMSRAYVSLACLFPNAA